MVSWLSQLHWFMKNCTILSSYFRLSSEYYLIISFIFDYFTFFVHSKKSPTTTWGQMWRLRIKMRNTRSWAFLNVAAHFSVNAMWFFFSAVLSWLPHVTHNRSVNKFRINATQRQTSYTATYTLRRGQMQPAIWFSLSFIIRISHLNTHTQHALANLFSTPARRRRRRWFGSLSVRIL